MIIESFDIKTSSERSFLLVQSSRVTTTRETRPVQIEQREGTEEDSVTVPSTAQRLRDMHRGLRHASLATLAERVSARAAGRANNNSRIPTSPEELKAKLLEMILELLTGRRVNLRGLQQQADGDSSRNRLDGLSGFFGFGAGGAQMETVESISVEHFHFESERVSYQAQGVVRTTDGRTINVDINMFMSRQFVSYMNIDVVTARPIDPLVINYGGTMASLLGERFEFDLTMDGTMDNLATLAPGSGFLAIDRNGDGIINDGSELFGPRTGCGFSELRKYDTDGNGWIDANDEIFSKLVVWSRDANGNDRVYTLQELGISAIFLGDIETEFSFKDENNQTLGIMRSTSFFLKEDGGAGTLSHIDLMV